MKKKNRAFKQIRRRRIDIDLPELDNILDTAVEKPITETDANKVKTALHVLVDRLTPQPRTTEKIAQVLGESTTPVSVEESKSPMPGHGRNGAAAFTSARKVEIPHSELTPGCICPGCQKGKVYQQKERKTFLRFAAQSPIQATVYEVERYRCNLCGEVFTAETPEDVGPEKYDETVPSMVAQLKYGSGMPFNRIEDLQKKLGVPLPASTQWELVRDAAELIKPAHVALIEQAAQAQVLHNDDTGMRVLTLERPDDDTRTGTFTSGVVSAGGGPQVALYFTGIQHAGENLRDVLVHRSKEAKAPPMLMCDALSRNIPKFDGPDSIAVILANCLSHGRRHFVDVADNFPDECRFVLETLGEVYKNDKQAREQGLNPEERLTLHKHLSEPLMEKLKTWIKAQLDEKRTEPNSGLGQAMKYMLKHWSPLTLFLRKAGAPLDNNICERALKKAVLHRKNALFYRTMNGAQVGDLFMSLIQTCQLNDVNPFNYMTELQRHAEELRKDPTAWMPWNYRETLTNANGPPPDS